MQKSATAALTAGLSGKTISLQYSVNEVVLKPYCQVVNLLLKTKDPNDVTAETDSEIAGYWKPSNMSPQEYLNELWLKKLRCPPVQDEYVLSRIFAEELLQPVLHSMPACWSGHKVAPSQKLACLATSLMRWRAASRPVE